MIILCFASLQDYTVYHLSNFVVSTVPVMLLHELSFTILPPLVQPFPFSPYTFYMQATAPVYQLWI